MGNQTISPDVGYAFRYKLKVNAQFIRIQNILLFEDNKQLSPAVDNTVINQGKGSYSLSEHTDGSLYVYFSSSDNSSPITNGRRYTLYLPLIFISHPLGLIYLGILLPGLIWFLAFALFHPQNREIIVHAPAGLLQVIDLFTEHISQIVESYLRNLWKRVKTRAVFWKRLFAISILLIYLYVFMEWLFFITMPSFMSLMSFTSKLVVFLLSGFGAALFCIIIVIIFILLDSLALVAHLSRFSRYLGLIIPTFILSTLVLLLIDNFTYTLFKFGISTSSGLGRIAYGVLFVLLTSYIYTKMMAFFDMERRSALNKRAYNRLFIATLSFLIITGGIALGNMDFSVLQPSNQTAETQSTQRMPNILLLGSDGLSAKNLSVYGYYRDTTPRLKELAQSSLIAENAFTNAGNTAGSVISIMTSKLPTQTRVLYPPDILTGINSFQHLPGILRNLGYSSIEFGAPYYIDAYSYNIQDGFDMVNNRTIRIGKLADFARKLGYDDEVYFLTRITWRISDRILHIFFIRQMQNPFDLVTQAVPNISDRVKIDQTLSLLDQSETPLFIHVHLLGTHGGFFNPRLRVYSKGEAQPQTWMTDFYDDTILSFDQDVGEVIDHLKSTGQYENTVLIIYTDHAEMFKVTERIPLIIHFPRDEYAGKITANVENMDIAPTVLDYLGLPEPQWMNGESLLMGDAIGRRLIFSTGTTKVKPNAQDISFLDPAQNKPPFYQFSYFNVLDCQKMYSLDLTTYEWQSGEVLGYVNPCPAQDLLSFNEIKQALYQRLSMDGFDISSLP